MIIILIKRFESRIYRYDLQKVVSAEDGAIIQPDHQSKSMFYVRYDSNFTILSDEKTVVGVDYEGDSDVLILENITKYIDSSYLPIRFGEHKRLIKTILYNKKINALLVGDTSGRVIQYDLGSSVTIRPKMVKDYGMFKIRSANSSANFGNLAVIGGEGQYLFIIINMKTRQVIAKSEISAIKDVSSINLCLINNNSQLALTLSGKISEYTEQKTDIYDITEVYCSSNDFSKNLSQNILLSKKKSLFLNFNDL